jgi:O-succinylhomoserine sulfhydrylase
MFGKEQLRSLSGVFTAMVPEDQQDWRPETLLVHGGVARSPFGETSEALFLTQGFVYSSAEEAEGRFAGTSPGYQYSRFGNPTVTMFEERMCALEGAQAARAFATGMAAVTAAVMSQVRAGDHIVAPRALFGSCRFIIEEFMPRYGVSTTLIDGTDLDQWRKAIRPNTKIGFLESPTNPTLDVIDIKAVADILHAAGAKLLVDNVFATPLFQKPLALGADLVIYSATKHIDGQGRCLGGVVLGKKELIEKDVQTHLRQTGPSLSPFNAWVLLKGMETLPLRIEKQTANAAMIADALADHPRLTRLIFPGRKDHPQADIIARQMTGGSTLIAFEVKGGKKAAFAFLNALKLIRISNNLGDTKSLITHPATTTHFRLLPDARAELGITEGLVRLSCGIEHPEDLLADLDRALNLSQLLAKAA